MVGLYHRGASEGQEGWKESVARDLMKRGPMPSRTTGPSPDGQFEHRVDRIRDEQDRLQIEHEALVASFERMASSPYDPQVCRDHLDRLRQHLDDIKSHRDRLGKPSES